MLKPFHQKNIPEAGCDEAGRGCLAGSVFAAAVILPADFSDPLLNDSKQINEKTRYALRETIQSAAISWAVASVDVEEIDKINILNASIKAMHLALAKLKPSPAFIIVDGNRFKPFQKIPTNGSKTKDTEHWITARPWKNSGDAPCTEKAFRSSHCS